MATSSASRTPIERVLAVLAEAGEFAHVLRRDARRLFATAQRLLAMDLVPPPVDTEALELAAHAWQLPLCAAASSGASSRQQPGHLGFRDRADQSAELLLSVLADIAPAERAATILREMPLRDTDLNEARILSDAVNLDDFGACGILGTAMRLARRNMAIDEVLDSLVKRREYGYFEALLKDGFHFEPVRQMARRRLDAALRIIDALVAELRGQA